MTDILEISEGVQFQSADEELAYRITTTNWASTPSNPSFAAYDLTTGGTVTSTVFPSGTASLNGDIITLPSLKSLSKGHTYRIEVKFTAGGSIWETYFRVKCLI